VSNGKVILEKIDSNHFKLEMAGKEINFEVTSGQFGLTSGPYPMCQRLDKAFGELKLIFDLQGERDGRKG